MFTTSDAQHSVKGLMKSFDNGVNDTIEMYMNLPVVDVYDSSIETEKYTSSEGISGTKQLGELETPPTATLGEGYAVSVDVDRFGLSILLPEQVYRVSSGDPTILVEQYLERQRNQALKDLQYRLVQDIHLFFNDAFNGNFLLAPDGLSIANGSHTWNSTSNTWSNTATALLDTAAVDAMEEAGGAFVESTGKERPITYDTIVVKKGSDNARTAKKLFAYGITPTAVNDINIYEGSYKIIETPYITTANKNYWFGMSSFEENPLRLKINERPTMRQPKVLDNEAIRSNITGFWKAYVANAPFALYCSNGTT